MIKEGSPALFIIFAMAKEESQLSTSLGVKDPFKCRVTHTSFVNTAARFYFTIDGILHTKFVFNSWRTKNFCSARVRKIMYPPDLTLG